MKADEAWGLAQLSVAAHDNHAAYFNGFETSGHPEDKWGWAIQGSLSIKNIPTGPGDVINVQAVYTDGASRYKFQNLAPQTFVMFGGASLPGAYQSIGVAVAADGVFGTTPAGSKLALKRFRPGACAVLIPTTGIRTGTPLSSVRTPS